MRKLALLSSLLACVCLTAWTQCIAGSVFEKIEQQNVSFFQFSMRQLELELRLEELERCRTAQGCAQSSSFNVSVVEAIPTKWPSDVSWYNDGMLIVQIAMEYPNSQIAERDIESFCQTEFSLKSFQFDDVRTSKLNILLPDKLKNDLNFVRSLHERFVLLVEININSIDSHGLLIGQEQLVCGGSPAAAEKWFKVISRNHIGQ